MREALSGQLSALSYCELAERLRYPEKAAEQELLEHKQSVGFGFMTGPRRGM